MENIPRPPGLPLVGNTYDVDFVAQTASLESLAEDYGPLFEVRLMQHSYVVCTNFEIFEELCDEKRFTKHPASGLGELRHGLGDGLFTAKYGEHNWEVAHRVLVPVFGPLAITKMFDDMHGIATQLVLKWARHGPESQISSTDDFTKLTLDTIALCSMSTRFNSFYRDEVHPFARSMSKVMYESGRRGSRIKVLNRFLSSATTEFFGNIDIMRNVCQGIIDEKRANPSGKNDLVNAMISRKDPKTGEYMSDENIINNMITFLVAGHETTSGFLAFFFYEMLKNPHEITKVQKEVDDVVGTGTVKVEHLTKLPYLTACLREAIRLHPPAAATYMITNPDNPDKVVSLCGGKYRVPKGTIFRNMIRLIQTDEAVYGADAHAFRPERMLDENFNKYPRNAWKPFGNGSRGCIGRDFAWQEATIVTAMLFQNFDFKLTDPDYELQIQQTLTVKPKDMFLHATPREGLDASVIEKRLHAGDADGLNGQNEVSGSHLDETEKKHMSIFFGGNMGTCESLAQKIANGASRHGYKADIHSLDEAVENMPKDHPVLIITSSYEGQPPDNAKKFVEWIENVDDKPFSGACYAVFGCGNRHWKETFQGIPKIVDAGIETAGGKRLTERGFTDAAIGNIFDDFEKWEDESFWPGVKAQYGGDDDAHANTGPELDVIMSSSPGSARPSIEEVSSDFLVVFNGSAADDSNSSKRHIEVQLPSDTAYRAGDYLAVLPKNPEHNVERVMQRFGLSKNATIYIKSKETHLPHETLLHVEDVLASFVEINQPATRRDIKKIMNHIDNAAIKMTLQGHSSQHYSTSILAKRTSILDILETYPGIDISFQSYLAMLPQLRPRHYSISSSPKANSKTCTLTYSVLDSPSWTNKSKRFLGVSTNYLASLKPGDHLTANVQASTPAFHLPPPEDEQNPATPIIMLCSGTGIAPFRGFIQERAALLTSSATLISTESSVNGEEDSRDKLGTAHLYAGYRDESQDRMYATELAEWTKEGAVEVSWACSRPYKSPASSDDGLHKVTQDTTVPESPPRSPGRGMYVQDVLWQDRSRLRDLIEERNATIFACGGRGLIDGIEEVLKKLRMEWSGGCCDVEEADKWFDGLREAGKYVADAFD